LNYRNASNKRPGAYLSTRYFIHPLDEDAITHLPLNSLFNFENSNKRPFLKVEGWALIRGAVI